MALLVERIFFRVIFLVILLCLRITPRKLIEVFGTGLAAIIFISARKERRTLFFNIENVLGLPSHSAFAKAFAKQVVRHQVLLSLEAIKSLKNPEILRVDGIDDLESVMTQTEIEGNGQIVVTGHLGSWELCGRFSAKAANRTLFALAKPARSKNLTEILEKIRRSFNMEILWTDDKNILRRMIAVLKQGSWLSFVMDQKPEGRIGPVVDFFGFATPFVSGPAKMSIRFNVPLLAAFCLREGPFHYRIVVNEILSRDHGLTDEILITQSLANEIERVIRLYPEQWCWNYKRWPLRDFQKLSHSPN